MQKNNNALFFTCSLIEYIARETKNRRKDDVLYLGEDLQRIYSYADVFHCEPIEKFQFRFVLSVQRLYCRDYIAVCYKEGVLLSA